MYMSPGLTFTWWGCYGLCLRHKPTELAHSFYSVRVSVSDFMTFQLYFILCTLPTTLRFLTLFFWPVSFCLYGPFSCISFHEFSRQLSTFSHCSSGLISALLVLSAIYLLIKVSFIPDKILCG